MAGDEKEVLDELNKKIQEFADLVFQYSQENLVRGGKIDTSTLMKTANINRGYLSASIVYPAEYATYVHDGRSPGSMPPVDALIPWVRRKLGINKESEAKKVAWAIAKAIEQRGIEEFPFARNALERAKSTW